MSWEDQAPHVALALEYCEQIVLNKIPACEFVKMSCQRQLDDLNREDFPFEFNTAAAERVCNYIEAMPHVKGRQFIGKNIRFGPWQCFVVTTPFGWLNSGDVFDDDGTQIIIKGTRRFRTVYEEVPRKNAKSTVLAGIGLYLLDADGEPGAEIYSAATTRSQAKIVFNIAQMMARKRVDIPVEVRVHNISKMEDGSKFEPLHAQGETLDGLNVHGVLNDELHAWQKAAVYGVLDTATGARIQPLIWNVTTAGTNIEGVCYDLRGYLIKILQKTLVDDNFFGVIYTIDEGDQDDWQNPEIWKKANPNWGISVSPIDIQAKARRAKESAVAQIQFLTKHLNVWCNAAAAWMDMMKWQACQDHEMSLDDFEGEECWDGIDLASKIDVSSKAKVFRRTIDGKEHIFAFMRHWLPEAAIKASPNHQYDGWVRAGFITPSPGNVIDVDMIEEDTLAESKRFRLRSLGVDPGHNSTQYGVHMAKELGPNVVVDVRPTVLNFSDVMKWLEAYVIDGRFHSNCPVLTWMVSNIVVKSDFKDNIYPRKEHAARKIDGVIALLMAMNRMKADEGSYDVYDDHELMVI